MNEPANLPSTTTAEEDLHSSSQRASATALENERERQSRGHRQTNLTWERTQAIVAVLVTMGVVVISGYMVVYGEIQLKLAAFLLLSQVFTQVVTEYFRRTNHTKSSGAETR